MGTATALPSALFAALCAALDCFDAGFVVALPDGRILHANLRAREMMARKWPIQSNNGRLEGCNKKATALLLENLRWLTDSASDEFCVDLCLSNATSPKGAAVATVKRLANAKLDTAPLALFVTSVDSRRACCWPAIAECFDLTPAETRTLHHLVEGGAVADAALALDVSENTVKTHLQKIFTKTGSSRQAHLISLVNALRPPLRFEARFRGSSAVPASAIAPR